MSVSSFTIRFTTLLMAVCMVAPTVLGDAGAPRIEPEQLRERINEPDLHLIDVRIVSDWRKSDRKILGAVRADPHDVSSWAKALSKDWVVVVYCS